jgi:hypothetical protein
VLGSEEIVHLEFDLAAGDEPRFAESIASLLSGVLKGELGRSDDVRGLLSPEERARAAAERAALLQALTADLDRELTGVQIEPRPQRRVSPLGLAEWRERSRGRTAQIVFRPFLGFVRGPIEAEYYGRFAREASGGAFVVTESYAYQASVAGTGPFVGGDVAYGVLPWLEVGIEGGGRVRALSRRRRNRVRGRSGRDSSRGVPERERRRRSEGARRSLPGIDGASRDRRERAPLERHAHRCARRAAGGDRHVPAPVGVDDRRRRGGEARVSRTVDLFVHIPIGVAIADETPVRHDGTGALGDTASPPLFDPFFVGAVAGVQIRIRP